MLLKSEEPETALAPFVPQFLKHAHRSGDLPITQVNHRKMEGGEVPLRHHLDKASVAQQFGLHDRLKVADAGAGEERGR